jgi:alanyl-tRNA synthetase
MSGHVVQMMKDAYPELLETERRVAKAIKIEEERYAHTTKLGLERLDETVVGNTTFGAFRRAHSTASGGQAAARASGGLGRSLGPGGRAESSPGQYTISGRDLFKLHDTFGLRPDFVEDIVENYGISADRQGYEAEMQKQRERARASWKGVEKKAAAPVFLRLAEERKTVFDGYGQTTSTGCQIVALVVDRRGGSRTAPTMPPVISTEAVGVGEQVEIVLDHTPFYAEAGGQVGDVGQLLAPDGDREVARITDTYYPVSGLIVHKAVARDALRVGDLVTAIVDVERRDATRRNHTATHLLHAALRRTLGTHVKQAGSLVAPDRLRFDFTHYAPLDEQDLLDVEDLVNERILKNEEVVTTAMDLDGAVSSGAMALFGEKYADQVRVLSIDDFSKELCGGTHVRRTGDIGLFKIISEGSVAAGTRRIEAVTGEGVLKQLRQAHETLALVADSLHAKPEELLQAVEKLAESEKKLRKELEAQQMKRAASQAGDLAKEAREVKGVRVVCARVEVTDRAAMRQMVDDLRAKLESGVIVLGSVSDGKVSLVAAVTKDLTNRLDASKIVKQAAAYVEGSGGGRKDLAEAGGKNAAKLDESLQAVPSIIEGML